MRRAVHRNGEAGAAAVDFVFICGLLVMLLLGVVQTAIYVYARNVVAASAADAARYAAAENVPVVDGGGRAEQLIRAGLDDADASAIQCTGRPGLDAVSGLNTATVRCTGRLRLIFLPLHLPLTIDVTSSALKEGAP